MIKAVQKCGKCGFDTSPAVSASLIASTFAATRRQAR